MKLYESSTPVGRGLPLFRRSAKFSSCVLLDIKVNLQLINCRILVRNFSTSLPRRDRLAYFYDNLKYQAAEMRCVVNEGKWPKSEIFYKPTRALLYLLQKEICNLSLVNKNREAMFLIEKYCFNLCIRYLAIIEVKRNSGAIPGPDGLTIGSDRDLLFILLETGEFRSSKWTTTKNIYIGTSKLVGFSVLSAISIKDRVMQTSFCFLLDPYYESKFPVDLYGFSRGSLQAVGTLGNFLDKKDFHYFCLINLSMEQCFGNIDLSLIESIFFIPQRYKYLLRR